MLTGRCLCGSVRYRITGTPLALLYCHCEECRRATGSSLNTSVLVKRDDFQVVSGGSAVSHFETSPGDLRHFCSRCGSPPFKLVRCDVFPVVGSSEAAPAASSRPWRSS